MSYIVGTYLPRDTTLIYSLTHIYGIGSYHSKLICKKAGLGQDCKIEDINMTQISNLAILIESLDIKVGSTLRRFNNYKIQNLCDITSYRGSRHRKGLPVRG